MTESALEVSCVECERDIKTRDNLIVAFKWFGPQPFHAGCFAKSIRGLRTLFINNVPLNGGGFMLTTIVCTFIAILFAVNALGGFEGRGINFNGPNIMFVLLLAPALLRLYSWARYERHLRE